MPHRDQHTRHILRGEESVGRFYVSRKHNSPPSQSSPPPSSRTLMQKVRSLFSWIAGRATEEAREEQLFSEAERSAKRALSQYSSRDLIRKATSLLTQVEVAKQTLLQEMGPSSQAFIDRYISPIADQIEMFLQEFRELRPGEALKGAVGSVELLAMLHDSTRVFRKIRDSLEVKTRDVILEDIAFILSYPSEVVEDAVIPVAQRAIVVREIEEALQPILMELEFLLGMRPEAIEPTPLFKWRTRIDQKRQQIHDRAMQVIDDKIHKRTFFWRSLKDLPANEIVPFLEGATMLSENEQLFPLSLFELEEVSSHLREIIEGDASTRQDKRLRQLINHLRSHVETILRSDAGEEHEEALGRIIDQVREIELLLGLRGSEDSFS